MVWYAGLHSHVFRSWIGYVFQRLHFVSTGRSLSTRTCLHSASTSCFTFRLPVRNLSGSCSRWFDSPSPIGLTMCARVLEILHPYFFAITTSSFAQTTHSRLLMRCPYQRAGSATTMGRARNPCSRHRHCHFGCRVRGMHVRRRLTLFIVPRRIRLALDRAAHSGDLLPSSRGRRQLSEQQLCAALARVCLHILRHCGAAATHFTAEIGQGVDSCALDATPVVYTLHFLTEHNGIVGICCDRTDSEQNLTSGHLQVKATHAQLRK